MKVTIITVVFNNEKFIEDCINSVLNQNYKDIEYIVIDGKSTDGTMSIIDKYRNKINTIISEKDKGMYDALNKGLKLASGDIIGLLHSDDTFYGNDVIEKIVHAFEENDINALHGDLIYVHKEQPEKIVRFWKSTDFSIQKLKNGWMPPHPTLFLRKELLTFVPSFQLHYKIAADYDFMLRVFTSPNIKSYYLPIIITKMRLGGTSNKSIKNIINKSFEDYLILKRNKVGGIRALFFKNFNKINQFFKS